MSRVIVKNNRVAIAGGRVVTTAGGAPCCCGGGPSTGTCWLILLRCNCNDLREAVSLVYTQAVEADWSYDERRAGVAVKIGGSCYRFIASTTRPPSVAATVDWDNYTGDKYASCDESPCADQVGCPCPDDQYVLTASIFLDPLACMPGRIDLCGIESVEYTFSAFGRYFRSQVSQGCESYLRETMSLNFSARYSMDDGFTELSGSGNTSGIDVRCRSDGNGGREQYIDRQWNQNQTYTSDDIPTQAGGDAVLLDIDDTLDFTTRIELLKRTTGRAPQQLSLGKNEWLCCCRVDEPIAGDPDIYRRASSTGSQTATSTSFSASYEFVNGITTSGVTRESSQYTLSISRKWTLFGGVVIEDEDCDRPPPMVAYACEAGTIPDRLVYDPRMIPDGIEHITIGAPDADLPEPPSYYITSQVSPSDPVFDVVPTEQGCPDDPQPTGDIYRINRCGSTQRAVGAVVVGDTLEGRTIGYRPGDGLRAGEGRVVYEGSDGQCLARLAGQPTTQVLDEEPDIILTSEAGVCSGYPVVRIDPRPGCQDQPGGGGGPGGSDAGQPGGIDDPAILAEIARQQQARTGQYPGRCPSCGG